MSIVCLLHCRFPLSLLSTASVLELLDEFLFKDVYSTELFRGFTDSIHSFLHCHLVA
jgi:hypothetical protein